MSEIESPIKLDISESTNGILNALFLPATKQVGMALGNTLGLINTATLPFRFINVYSQENFKRFADKVKYIPEEKIKEVEPEIAIPLIEKLSYTSNSDLAEAYANLLAKASNKDDVDLVHPGFINKINSMAPDEIRILEYLKDKNDIEYIFFRVKNDQQTKWNLGYKLTGLENIFGLTSEKIQIHIENLISLNILEDKEGVWFNVEDGYNKLIELYKDTEIEYKNFIEANEHYGKGRILFIGKSYYKVTTIGQTFIKACTNTSVVKV